MADTIQDIIFDENYSKAESLLDATELADIEAAFQALIDNLNPAEKDSIRTAVDTLDLQAVVQFDDLEKQAAQNKLTKDLLLEKIGTNDDVLNAWRSFGAIINASRVDGVATLSQATKDEVKEFLDDLNTEIPLSFAADYEVRYRIRQLDRVSVDIELSKLHLGNMRAVFAKFKTMLTSET